jgi:tungstate transport system permease protein
MHEMWAALATAARLIATLDRDLVEIVLLSLKVNFSSVALASLVGLPLGASLALFSFVGRRTAIVIVSALMGLPPVVVGLVVYLLLSRAGPFGVFGLLYSPTAMIIAQVILVTPIITALTRQTVEDLWDDYREQLRSLGAGPSRALPTLLWEGRFTLTTAVLAGLGRATAEVGAVMIVGGNIDHLTRVMTTTISLETSKGNLALALGLGIILVVMSIAVNASAFVIRDSVRESAT